MEVHQTYFLLRYKHKKLFLDKQVWKFYVANLLFGHPDFHLKKKL